MQLVRSLWKLGCLEACLIYITVSTFKNRKNCGLLRVCRTNGGIQMIDMTQYHVYLMFTPVKNSGWVLVPPPSPN